MSDVNAFIDAIGKDVNATVVPRVESLAEGIGAKALADYVPKIAAFANQLVKEIVDEQSVVVRDFTAALIQDLFQRYRPEIAGQLRTKVVRDGLAVVGEGVRLDLKRRDTGAAGFVPGHSRVADHQGRGPVVEYHRDDDRAGRRPLIPGRGAARSGARRPIRARTVAPDPCRG